MKYHIKYWYARLRNDFLRLIFIRPSEQQYVEEVMGSLRRDPELRRHLKNHGDIQ